VCCRSCPCRLWLCHYRILKEGFNLHWH
jgi:hypothetical protein